MSERVSDQNTDSIFEEASVENAPQPVVVVKKKKAKTLPPGCPPDDYTHPPVRDYFNKGRVWQTMHPGEDLEKMKQDAALNAFILAFPEKEEEARANDSLYSKLPYINAFKDTEDWGEVCAATKVKDAEYDAAVAAHWAANPECYAKKKAQDLFKKNYNLQHPVQKKSRKRIDPPPEHDEERSTRAIQQAVSSNGAKFFQSLLEMNKKMRVEQEIVDRNIADSRRRQEGIVFSAIENVLQKMSEPLSSE